VSTPKRLGIFKLEVSNKRHEAAYLKLPSYPTERFRASKSFRLVDVIGKYAGPDVVFDFDPEGVLVGIEVLAE